MVTELPHGVSVRQVMEEIEAIANPRPSGNKKEVSQEQKRLKQFILDQVESGVAVRMALLYLLAGGHDGAH